MDVFYLYVILDVFSRYVVGWTVQYRETAQVAKALIEQSTEQQQITPRMLTLHADRGGPMRSKPVAFLLADLGVTKTHSRPYTSTDNPYSEAQLQDAEVPARVPRAVRRHRARPRSLPVVLRLVQPPPPPLRDRADDPGRRPPRPRARAPRRPRQRVLDAAYAAPPRAVRPQAARTARATDRRVDQQARHTKEVAH